MKGWNMLDPSIYKDPLNEACLLESLTEKLQKEEGLSWDSALKKAITLMKERGAFQEEEEASL